MSDILDQYSKEEKWITCMKGGKIYMKDQKAECETIKFHLYRGKPTVLAVWSVKMIR